MKYIEKLIRAGGAINHKSLILRVTPLHCAAGLQNQGLVKLLLENGANVDVTDILGRTPLDHALSREYSSSADLICKAGGKSGKNLRLSRSEARKSASTISFICKSCKKELSVSAKFGGKSGTCNYCGAKTRVPYFRPKLARMAKTGSAYGLAFVLSVGLLYLGSILTATFRPQMKQELISDETTRPLAPTRGEPLTNWRDPGAMSMAAIREKRLIVDVHENIGSLAEAPLFLKAMDQLGIEKACLMGSSKFTLTLSEPLGFTDYDENNEELLKIVQAYPGRFEAWPTLSPVDPDKMKKIQDLIARGAAGVMLYTGHGYVTKEHEYMFHPVALDDPAMLSFYSWCEQNYIPIMLHVNPHSEKKGFAEEFVAVLTQFPNLKVVAPSFIMSSIKSDRLRELLDTFPNLYSEISFGDFMGERFRYISKEPEKFRKIFADYPDRFMFATALVMIKGRKDDWATVRFQAYIDMLTQETYTSPAIPGETLRGLELSDELLSRILFRNYHAFRQYRPVNSKPRKEIDWKRMSVEPVERKPGEAFPPTPKAEGKGRE